MPRRTAKCSYVWLKSLVRFGLAHFARSIDQHLDLAVALENEARSYIAVGADWRELRSETLADWTPGNDTFAKLVATLELDLPDAFLLALVGEVETSHTLNMMLSALQQPGNSARPSVHFASVLVDDLFNGDTFGSDNLHANRLIREEVLQVVGTAPTPLCDLRVHPHLWAVIRGESVTWPGCTLIEPPRAREVPRSLRGRMSEVGALVMDPDNHGLIVRGLPGSGRGVAVGHLARRIGLRALRVPVDMWGSEPALAVACRIAGWLPTVAPALGPGDRWSAPLHGAKQPVAVILTQDGSVDGGRFIELNVPLPTHKERRDLWSQHVDDPVLCDALAARVLVNAPHISQIGHNALVLAGAGEPVELGHILQARRGLGGDRLRLLAQPVEAQVSRNALVLTEATSDALDDMTARAGKRGSVWHELGITLQAVPSNGLRALFVGESGTGKTLAASFVASQIGAPLYRVDMAAVMSKYIGESEKNLSALLDDAAAYDVALLFDEAEGTFSKRGESRGQDAGQHFSDMLTNFLLSRIENHPGVVILTTNRKERIDSAFLRRLDYVIEFPLPNFDLRRTLWANHLGRRMPDKEICTTLASYCDLPGGNIRNVVLNAASRQASNEPSIARSVLIDCVRAEYRKLGRTSPPQLKNFEQPQ